ncbi:MAG: septal ring lytic transglycosylase RlpA family protein [Patescibacteria group bacterium]
MKLFTTLSIIFGLALLSMPATPVQASSSELFPLYAGWYEVNDDLMWNDITILFDAYQPEGRLSLQESFESLNGVSDVVSAVYKWQFIDALIDNPLTATIQFDSSIEGSVVAYINTAGTWQQVASTQTDSSVSFVIQSSSGQVVLAKGQEAQFIELPFSGEVLQKGYTIETPAKDLRVGIMPNLVSIDFTAKIRSLPGHYSRTYLDDGMAFASEVYHVWLDSAEGSLPFSRSLPIELAFPAGNDEYKAIYYFDPGSNTWNLSPSTTRYTSTENAEGYVRTLTYQKELIIAVVTDPMIKEWGMGSWFTSDLIPRNRRGSANNDYPLGTVVRVTNLDNEKYVDTEIISRGPYADFRIVDLGSDVFKEIASLGAGVIPVKVEPVDKLP